MNSILVFIAIGSGCLVAWKIRLYSVQKQTGLNESFEQSQLKNKMED